MTFLSIITLNINRLNSPIKQHRVAGWIKINNQQQKRLNYTMPTRDSLQL